MVRRTKEQVVQLLDFFQHSKIQTKGPVVGIWGTISFGQFLRIFIINLHLIILLIQTFNDK